MSSSHGTVHDWPTCCLSSLAPRGSRPVPQVAICTEKRQGNKRVTKVAGVEAFLVEPDALSSEFQKKFAASTSVVDLPGKGAGVEVIVQVSGARARHAAACMWAAKPFRWKCVGCSDAPSGPDLIISQSLGEKTYRESL